MYAKKKKIYIYQISSKFPSIGFIKNIVANKYITILYSNVIITNGGFEKDKRYHHHYLSSEI